MLYITYTVLVIDVRFLAARNLQRSERLWRSLWKCVRGEAFVYLALQVCARALFARGLAADVWTCPVAAFSFSTGPPCSI